MNETTIVCLLALDAALLAFDAALLIFFVRIVWWGR